MGLEWLIHYLKRRGEQGVDEIQDGRLAAKVLSERQAPGSGNARPHGIEHSRIGPAKPVDRLLRVADDEELAAVEIVTDQGFHDLRLHGIRILKLVDQKSGNRRACLASDHGRLPQQVPSPNQEIVKSEQARLRFSGREVAGGGLDHVDCRGR